MPIKDVLLPLVGEPGAAAIAAIDKCMAVIDDTGARVMGHGRRHGRLSSLPAERNRVGWRDQDCHWTATVLGYDVALSSPLTCRIALRSKDPGRYQPGN